ncbi:type II toxin-antitoxin system HicA family toxin [Algoriphagus sp. H41]|uniref:Type II toxin-antitoxin system HicA family toxin n=1 Tax=Algoriphagus oliviformis TaxID=2811231 RepID=A0ABS3BZJ6_9BACT|nr:type II toxin-antitoxin system HicA family toxin [Algoriphagus oliviformis]MBN7810292.1 type II toxin-antitoxin system HicA family toxin [Algoriphagus oliviformis]
MEKFKVKDVLRLLSEDGWYLREQRGSHRQFKHPVKKGRVTLNGKPSDTLSQELLNSIWKQAGWK